VSHARRSGISRTAQKNFLDALLDRSNAQTLIRSSASRAASIARRRGSPLADLPHHEIVHEEIE
jgi:hypothetical protein